jgi:hypothetical protein
VANHGKIIALILAALGWGVRVLFTHTPSSGDHDTSGCTDDSSTAGGGTSSGMIDIPGFANRR